MTVFRPGSSLSGGSEASLCAKNKALEGDQKESCALRLEGSLGITHGPTACSSDGGQSRDLPRVRGQDSVPFTNRRSSFS